LVKAITKPTKLDIAPFSHPLRSELLGALTEAQLMDGMHVVQPSGEIRTGPDGLLELLSTIAPVAERTLGEAHAGSTLQALVRGNYKFIAKHRGKLARFVPNVEAVVRVGA
jgi:hypothetical protein